MSQTVVDKYLNGHYNVTGFLIHLGQNWTDDARRLKDDPFIAQHLAELPHDDEGWSLLRVFAMGSWVGTSQDHIEAGRREDAKNIRIATERLRALFAEP